MRKIEWLHQTGIAARAMSLSYQAFAAASGQLIDEDVLKAFLMAELRANAKIRGIVKNLHSRVIAFLCTHEVVLLPWFRISNMVSKETSVLTASTKRVGLSQSHYMFKQRLINKAVETGTKVIFVDERFTSRTCPRCWTWHKNLGGGKVFICPRPECGYTAGRDHNAAFLILAKAIANAAVYHFIARRATQQRLEREQANDGEREREHQAGGAAGRHVLLLLLP